MSEERKKKKGSKCWVYYKAKAIEKKKDEAVIRSMIEKKLYDNKESIEKIVNVGLNSIQENVNRIFAGEKDLSIKDIHLLGKMVSELQRLLHLIENKPERINEVRGALSKDDVKKELDRMLSDPMMEKEEFGDSKDKANLH